MKINHVQSALRWGAFDNISYTFNGIVLLGLLRYFLADQYCEDKGWVNEGFNIPIFQIDNSDKILLNY